MSKKLTNDIFVSKAISVHGYRYGYKQFVYTDFHSKGKIECHDHGIFLQAPSHHLAGKGCPKCKGEKSRAERQWTKEKFLKKAIEVHDNKYSYIDFDYKGYHTKSKINCYIHGDFLQTPGSHLYGRGCPRCGDERGGIIHRLTTEEYIKRAIGVHGNLYNYDKTIYTKATVKCCIVCPKHGDFWQSPFHHLNGTGCPYCNSSKGELTIKTILDKHNIKNKQEYKIPELKKHYNKNYEYDFYLEDYNLLIEFHGIQHYKYHEFFHRTKENFEHQVFKDTEKREIARSWGYKYLVIKHTLLEEQSKEEFEKQLMRYLKRSQ